ncbi:hypothetical protein BBJ28_00013015 [Nothophytophthora sp. Chile5]|nr:hypothetical protein BBJ28_00013015 [Nothophytophthora sp. Chile5]
MVLSARGVLAQTTLVSFNALLGVYCLAVVLLEALQPCSSSSLLSTDPRAHTTVNTCSTSSLELFTLSFHLAFAALAFAGACVAFIGHLVLVRITRGMLVLFAAFYVALAIWELTALRRSPLIPPLELTVALLTLAIGWPSGLIFERELRCDRQVLPDGFDSVLPTSPTPSMTQIQKQKQVAKAAADSAAYKRVPPVGAEAPGLTCLGDHVTTTFVAETALPTAGGTFRVRAYRSVGSLRESEPIAMISGDVRGQRDVPVRVHDQCFTSEVFGSLKCDCREQLDFAKAYTKQHGGVVIYMPQEGRGIGLANKIMAYSMQEQGLDTVDANRVLGFKDDYRSYEPVPAILKDLGIKSIRLLTNNPRKIRMLSQLGIKVEGRLPVVIKGGEHSQGYLTAKAVRMSHLLPGAPDEAAKDASEEDTSTDESQDEEEQPAAELNPQEPVAAADASSPTASISSSSSESY